MNGMGYIVLSNTQLMYNEPGFSIEFDLKALVFLGRPET